MTFLLSEAGPAIEAACRRMFAKPSRALGVVIIDEIRYFRKARFVQFCTKDADVLFGVPALKIVAEPIDLEDAAECAITGLKMQGVPETARVRITEESQGPDDGEPIRRLEYVPA